MAEANIKRQNIFLAAALIAAALIIHVRMRYVELMKSTTVRVFVANLGRVRLVNLHTRPPLLSYEGATGVFLVPPGDARHASRARRHL